MDKNMNVVFIMTDQQRADAFGKDRHPCADYPNMEQLRSESVSFNNFLQQLHLVFHRDTHFQPADSPGK